MTENSKDDQSEEGSFFYRFIRVFFAFIFSIFFRVKVYGMENLPEKGGFVICANNISCLDPLMIMRVLGKRRQVFFMAKEELFKIPVFGLIMRKLGSFPVKRKKVDRKAVEQALSLLRQDRIVGIFPEGARSKRAELQKPFDNQSMIALKSKASILPLAIKGPYRLFKTVRVSIGAPLTFDYDCVDKRYKRERIRKTNGMIMDSIKGMLESH